MERPPQHNVATKNSKPTSVYIIADIIKNVNPLDKYFLKYVPDSLLNAEQIIAKNEAINEDQIRLSDMRYEYAVENNPSLARDMLIEKSNKEGYAGADYFTFCVSKTFHSYITRPAVHINGVTHYTLHSKTSKRSTYKNVRTPFAFQ